MGTTYVLLLCLLQGPRQELEPFPPLPTDGFHSDVHPMETVQSVISAWGPDRQIPGAHWPAL